MRPRSVLLALGAGLALADASIVTLALPELLVDLDTSVEGVAAVLAVYTLVLAVVLVPLERLARVHGPRRVGTAGFIVFGLASLACAPADSLAWLLVARAVQAVGGAAALVCAFDLLVEERGDEAPRQRGLWLGAAVLSTAVGPALGGVLTQLFSWEAIFLVQVPLALAAAVATATAPDAHLRAQRAGEPTHSPFPVGPSLALGLLSAALSAVLFLLVLLLVAGWAVEPITAAIAVTVLPAAALVGSRVGGDARMRAAAGCLLVAGGTAALAFLPGASVAWTVPPQVLAGLGMGMALPALGGELLPERDARDAARLLAIRHLGIFLALAILAPIAAQKLDTETYEARLQGVALVLDAEIAPQRKLQLAPTLLGGVSEERPRAALEEALKANRDVARDDELGAYDQLAERADDVLVNAVGDAFFLAFLITAGFALAGALVLLPGARQPAWALAAAGAGIALVVGMGVVHDRRAPEQVVLADPCEDRDLPGTGGITGFLQDRALELADRAACEHGSTREEYVLALASEEDRKRYQDAYGVDPRSLGGIIDTILGN